MPRRALSARRVELAPVALGDILSGLSHALDITEGHERGHTTRSCLIGMRLADIVGLSDTERLDLYYALLIKDAGGSSNSSRMHELFGGTGQGPRPGLGLRDWRSLSREAGYTLEYGAFGGSIWDRIAHLGHLAKAGRQGRRLLFRIRSNRGARLALGLGLSETTAAAIRSMDEHWDGGGDPMGLQGDQIPLLSRLIGLAQVAEVFSHVHDEAAALDVVARRRGRWFDPDLADAFRVLAADSPFWQTLRHGNVDDLVRAAEPRCFAIVVDETRLDQIADAFASLIDAKSPYTSDHSRRVARLSVQIAKRLGFSDTQLIRIRRAALLHDIGKLGVPSRILEKPSPLTPEEWGIVRRHPAFTLQILDAVPSFREFAFDAACHHEKLDGSGYHQGYKAEQLTPTARALTVADMTDALLTDRPYRAGLDPLETLRILRSDCASGLLCPRSVGALSDYVADIRSSSDSGRADDAIGDAPSAEYDYVPPLAAEAG